MFHYRRNIPKALALLLPEVNFDASKFSALPSIVPTICQNRKKKKVTHSSDYMDIAQCTKKITGGICNC